MNTLSPPIPDSRSSGCRCVWSPTEYQQAVAELRGHFANNPWFTDDYWPENQHRVERMVRLGLAGCRDLAGPLTVLDVGCGVGFIAYLFRKLGCSVDGVDGYDDAERTALLEPHGIGYRSENLNVVDPLAGEPSKGRGVVLLGEVFEHILNQPAGLLRAAYRILRPGGICVLTTPNPSTLANALRLLGDRYVLWGTDLFLRETKVDGAKIIDHGGIHYHEYPAWVVADLMRELGFQICQIEYVRAGLSPKLRGPKRWIKQGLEWTGIGRNRIFSPGYIIIARRPELG